MAVYILNRPRSPIVTMKFDSFNEAIAFNSKSVLLKPSKPYKRMEWQNGRMLVKWCVSVSTPKTAVRATYKRIA